MPARSPKKYDDLANPARPRPTYHDRRRRKRVLISVSALVIIGIVIGWSLAATFPDVRPGDTVRIRYVIYAEGGTYLEGAEDLTVYVDPTIWIDLMAFYVKIGDIDKTSQTLQYAQEKDRRFIAYRIRAEIDYDNP